MTVEQRFLNIHQVAERYAVSEPTIWSWMQQGNFPQPVRITPGCSRWPLTLLDEFDAGLLEERAPRAAWERQRREREEGREPTLTRRTKANGAQVRG